MLFCWLSSFFVGYLQSLVQISNQVVKILHAHGQTHQVVSYTQLLPDLLGHRSMSHESRALCQTFHSSQWFSQSEDSHCFQKFGHLFLSTLDSDAQHSAKPSHLLFGPLVKPVAFKSWINDILDVGVFFQVVSNVKSVLCSAYNSQLQCLESPQGQVAVERTGTSPDAAGCKESLIMKGFVLENKSTHDEVRVSSNIFGEWMISNICA